MANLLEAIQTAKEEGKTLFYNTTGSKKAYQLNIKHISSAEYLGYASLLPNGDLLIRKNFLLVDFEDNKVITIQKDSRITPVKLENS